ncbi:hypothetical protein NLO83_04310 [Pseudomonas tremae]|uniref:hypothetical protein n=1 Tax=Pseudomonas syringae group TaxID=136849 RepID=UPI0001AF4590|nr:MULTISPECIES: hypothetical protein [Pseudomonas syringae group]KPZ25711.1 Uncharacterized protein ALO38_02842 [Pseudomonas coronafaciens pv. zizaniae]MCQ3014832.1 hypothetical protein [Pseudomonas tremae]QGL56637.1 hypothetical protein POR16_09880 [Pseudomonas coronafaciens pv. oryzae str. 1_6]RMM37182.1 hypothetical protein ALQ80_00629 [Pseudomonas coronafaciens pv. oryzae]RMN23273.1 hypothetical protein ALQ62_02320 [Pseudomonas coronafaciens pv. zizaniae]
MNDTNTLKVATIAPGPQSHPGSPHLAQGTKVILSDGSELTGVTRITLRAEAGDVWKAIIEVHPQTVQIIAAEADTCVVDCTSLNDERRRYAMAKYADPDTPAPTDGTVLLDTGEELAPHGM